ncbi:helix-turn-helix domain-containing protein [Flavobacterium agricola]|uniref:Helix-turn-helix domain-containing protein n=1 Tax=Flavobacterium agricola TaxID=2870839 RepID=A0ABY6M1T6_9FLAO|nr:helix-turn-helix domain-containing protein [Flavobacterium agricola]UYW02501.1 helix-turn-helix domain-containing protein [Flavobacterium agricola]
MTKKSNEIFANKNSKEKRKEIDFVKGYFLYEDGRCYSEKSNKFLSKVRTNGKTPNKYYYMYDLTPYGGCLVSRLVMYVFGDHEYTNFKEMPKVIQVDGDPENSHISNLKFATQSEINLINNIKPSPVCYTDTGTIKIKDKKLVVNMLAQNFTYKKIAAVFETSEMSVYRFVKRHIKGQTV